VIEEWTYEQMALVASSFAFSWSKWNSEAQDKEKILFQASEALQDEPLLEVRKPPSLQSQHSLPLKIAV
jgi:hypothetical protein